MVGVEGGDGLPFASVEVLDEDGVACGLDVVVDDVGAAVGEDGVVGDVDDAGSGGVTIACDDEADMVCAGVEGDGVIVGIVFDVFDDDGFTDVDVMDGCFLFGCCHDIDLLLGFILIVSVGCCG